MTTMRTAPNARDPGGAAPRRADHAGDAAYDEARRVWNGMFDRRPGRDRACAGCGRRGGGRRLRPRDGHRARSARRRPLLGRLLDRRRRDRPRLLAHEGRLGRSACARSRAHRRAALWGDVDRETQAHGLAVPGGQISHTGHRRAHARRRIGWLSRQHGLTIDNLLSVELVTADGRARDRVGVRAPGPLLGPARRLRQLRRRRLLRVPPARGRPARARRAAPL